MICPNCREDNAPGFRFCGMCGTPLEPRRPAGAPALDPLSAFPPSSGPSAPVPVSRAANAPGAARAVAVENGSRLAEQRPVDRKEVPPISGPSMLGLSQAAVSPMNANAADPHLPNQQQPSMDSLRERAFSGMDSFLEPYEEPKRGGRRILLMLVLLVALGAAGWWTYSNYLGITQNPKVESAASSPAVTSSNEPVAHSPTQNAVPSNAGSAQNASPSSSSGVPGSSETATTNPGPSQHAASSEAKTMATAKSVAQAPAVQAPAATVPTTAGAVAPTGVTPITRTPTTRTPAKASGTEKLEAKSKPRETYANTTPALAVAANAGDAALKKGEAYLYGQGVPANCDEATKYLKEASAKSNAKARGVFGTMYATGHCVPRDLPTSYRWFAMALRLDPNNQVLEDDLTAIWNQMTPPERQLAMRLEQ